MAALRCVISLILLAGLVHSYPGVRQKPPVPKYGSIEPHNDEWERSRVAEQIDDLSDEDDVNPWELSGLYEGDMLLESHDARNGILNETMRWPNATVPYYIEDDDFIDEQQLVILKAIKEYHKKTCVKFRPYHKSDTNWVVFRSNASGCWSSVGMQTGGQTVNLQSPGCVRHGVVVHELLHALGFFHQQSASNRDEYVRIVWDNIEPGHEHNFNKYNDSVVTSYGTDYDYGSVMHYSAKAFSRNKQPTIEALEANVTLGQRKGLSEKDVTKLDLMYESRCAERANGEEHPGFLEQFNALLGFTTANMAAFGRV
ncbi:seminal metalloprotease 1-like [Toxorhynchites rutilus septentrionalis]|uniref:seminal metalloprotease 1-like n=1 Tax=Toxorhynchites rutilus septentrionalis TaxID=329112 RepID=UPI00247A792D|nr:seminal metalloprotease 1-like [Toxorhynchites rutilus septentrionalis]